MRRLRILYCDDDQDFIDDFARRHEQDVDVIGETDISKVVNVVDRSRRFDLVLLDLFHPLDSSTDTSRAEMDSALRRLSEAERELRDAVRRNSQPLAIQTLKRLRLRYPAHKLPVLIFSRRGLILLEKDQISEINRAGAGWMLKHNPLIEADRIDPEDELYQLEHFVQRERKAGVRPRDVSVAAIFLCLGIVADLILSAIGLQ